MVRIVEQAEYDAVICGGNIGILLATALVLRGRKGEESIRLADVDKCEAQGKRVVVWRRRETAGQGGQGREAAGQGGGGESEPTSILEQDEGLGEGAEASTASCTEVVLLRAEDSVFAGLWAKAAMGVVSMVAMVMALQEMRVVTMV